MFASFRGLAYIHSVRAIHSYMKARSFGFAASHFGIDFVVHSDMKAHSCMQLFTEQISGVAST
jgi:hypothetical protein